MAVGIAGGVGIAVGVAVGVGVDVGLGAGVGFGVGVAVGKGKGVRIAVEVAEGAGAAVGVGAALHAAVATPKAANVTTHIACRTNAASLRQHLGRYIGTHCTRVTCPKTSFPVVPSLKPGPVEVRVVLGIGPLPILDPVGELAARVIRSVLMPRQTPAVTA